MDSTGQQVTEQTTQQAMTVTQANFVNAKTSTFEYFKVDFDISAMNDEADFALAA